MKFAPAFNFYMLFLPGDMYEIEKTCFVPDRETAISVSIPHPRSFFIITISGSPRSPPQKNLLV